MTPPTKPAIIAGYEKQAAKVQDQFDQGLTTDAERRRLGLRAAGLADVVGDVGGLVATTRRATADAVGERLQVFVCADQGAGEAAGGPGGQGIFGYRTVGDRLQRRGYVHTHDVDVGRGADAGRLDARMAELKAGDYAELVRDQSVATWLGCHRRAFEFFGGITACDAVANGIVGALEILGDEASKPLVVRLDGNNVEEGRRILAEANHPLVTVVDTMDGAAEKAAEFAGAAQ